MALARILLEEHSLQSLLYNNIILNERNSHYVLSVLRLKSEKEIIAVDGKGRYIKTILIRKNKKECELKASKKMTVVPNHTKKVALALSLGSQSSFNDAIQKTTELGVDIIIPIDSKFSQSSKGKINNHKIEHWRKVIKSAFLQSQRNFLTKLAEITTLQELIISMKNKYSQFNALSFDPNSNCSISLKTIKSFEKKSVMLIIGAEGGWSDLELRIMKQNNIANIKLSEKILRYETAACSAVTLFNLLG